MSVKITLGTAEPQPEKNFPKLMKCIGDSWAKGAIVFFFSPSHGMRLTQAIEGDLSNPTGEVAHSWDMKKFEDYNEPLTITFQNRH